MSWNPLRTSTWNLEYTGAIAKGATINFVYTGNASNTGGAFFALQYAIQNKLAGELDILSYQLCASCRGIPRPSFVIGAKRATTVSGSRASGAMGITVNLGGGRRDRLRPTAFRITNISSRKS